MRVALVALLALPLAFAGCGDLPARGENLEPTCPAWRKGLSTNVFQEGFVNTTFPESKYDPAHPTGAGLTRFQDLPLDLVDLDFNPTRTGQPQAVGVANGTLELRVFRSDGSKDVSEQLLLHDLADGPNGERRDVWTWGPGVHRNFTLQVTLAEPHEDPRPDPIVLRWDFLPDANPRTPSEAVMLYTAYFWYRTCGSA